MAECAPLAGTGPIPVRHIVLIHGAWQGSWAFAAWQPLLRAAGWQVHAVDLPGNAVPAFQPWPGGSSPDLCDYTEHVLQLLNRLDGPAVLVGHSGGGITAAQVAQARPDAVAALVFLAGMMLPDGMDFAALIDACRQAHPHFAYTGVGPLLQWDANGSASRVPVAVAREIFLHDCPPALAAQAQARLVWQPESGRAMRNRLTASRYGRVPRIYVECLRDRSVLHVLQRHMQQLSPGALRVTLDCGHVPQLACPQLLTQRLTDALVRVQVQARRDDGMPLAVCTQGRALPGAQSSSHPLP
ncbi:alpha/beta fold hydrolase [Lampropedia cohaerens]|uniref:alpha/beta fold hydrolase n=1 Tax=Lampropedia cohaerens TaxID=1610491 RepID=UPI000A07D90C|nr:alpha/beta fold hydrolase [Lampropedia cohaerens]